jgi:phosphomannomutase
LDFAPPSPAAQNSLYNEAMKLNPHVFKAYDIRGIVPSQIDEEFAFHLGMAFGTLLKSLGENKVCIGRDGRLSGPALISALSSGLVQAGLEVINIGLCTTPMLYYAAHTLSNSGIQITGSHNPKDYNGFKMVVQGRALYGKDIQDLKETMHLSSMAELGSDSVPTGHGFEHQVDVLPSYRKRILGDVHLSRPMKIVVDSGNGVAGATAPAIFRALGAEVIELFSEVDGHFPNHHPDPSKPENLKDLIAAIEHHGAELGFAFDGDGDRLGVVTRQGQNIYPDRQMQLFAQDVLSREPGAHIIFDVKCSQRLAPAIRRAGGKPLMYKTGHSLIKAKMKELSAALGGEMSGHIFFKERWFGFDDGTYAGARLLEILSKSPDASAVLNALDSSSSTPELNVSIKEGEAPSIIQALLDHIQKEGLPAAAHHPVLHTIDGVRIDWEDGFGLIRASNTTPVLVLRFEGHTDVVLERIRKDMMHLLNHVLPGVRLQEAQH